MKIHIGPYLDWIGPYQIAEKLIFWESKYDENFNSNDKMHAFGKWLAEDKNGNDSYLLKLCNWIHSKQKRKVKIKIDRYDSWNAHNTLSMVILPVLKQLRETKHGSGFVDDEDVPEQLRSTYGLKDENDMTDSLHEARAKWMLDEVIWALEQDQPDCDWEDQYWEEHPELDFDTYPEDEGKIAIPVRWKKDGKCDWEARQKHQERINNGFRLMGKYWQSFWD